MMPLKWTRNGSSSSSMLSLRRVRIGTTDYRSRNLTTNYSQLTSTTYRSTIVSLSHKSLLPTFTTPQTRTLATVSTGLHPGTSSTSDKKKNKTTSPGKPAQNLIEKLVQKYREKEETGEGASWVRSGDFVTIRPHHILTHDNTGAVMKKFESIGVPKMNDPLQPVFALDHDVQNKSDANVKKYQGIEAFAKKHGVDFYPAGRGIGHQVMIEEGYAFPNTLTVASDSHSNMYGGVGCLGTPLVRTDAAAVWATGKTWWQVPPVVKVNLMGKLNPGVTGKDVIITLCARFNKGEVLNCAIEFSGQESLAELGVDDRLAIANMSTEWGALAAVFPCDNVTLTWLDNRSLRLGVDHPRVNQTTLQRLRDHPVEADSDATYHRVLVLDLSTVIPHASGPDAVSVATPVEELERRDIAIQKAYLVSCTNSRLSDLAQAAQVIGNQKIYPGVEFYVAAASSQVQSDAEAQGHWETLLNAGAKPLPPGCGPCIGLGVGLLKDGEVGISATNRNFKGRMGSRKAQAYLASPAVVAASAISGRICLPDHLRGKYDHVQTHFAEENLIYGSQDTIGQKTESNIERVFPVIEGFPKILEGEALYCGSADNLNTDGIYAGAHTYNDKLTKEDMAKVVMENYDPEFRSIMKKGDILIGGFNFGSGSSREQAATALLAAGIQAVIAGSFSETYKRNAINNGLLVMECPLLINQLRTDPHLTSAPTVRTHQLLQIDFRRGYVEISSPTGERLQFPLQSAVGREAQNLFLQGGLENWIRSELGL